MEPGRISLVIEADGDLAELDELTRGLEEDLLLLDSVTTVERPDAAGPPPEGAWPRNSGH